MNCPAIMVISRRGSGMYSSSASSARSPPWQHSQQQHRFAVCKSREDQHHQQCHQANGYPLSQQRVVANRVRSNVAPRSTTATAVKGAPNQDDNIVDDHCCYRHRLRCRFHDCGSGTVVVVLVLFGRSSHSLDQRRGYFAGYDAKCMLKGTLCNDVQPWCHRSDDDGDDDDDGGDGDDGDDGDDDADGHDDGDKDKEEDDGGGGDGMFHHRPSRGRGGISVLRAL